jgi:hypothetical protein
VWGQKTEGGGITAGLLFQILRYEEDVMRNALQCPMPATGGAITHLLLTIDGLTDSGLEGLIRTRLKLWDRLLPNHGALVNCNRHLCVVQPGVSAQQLL